MKLKPFFLSAAIISSVSVLLLCACSKSDVGNSGAAGKYKVNLSGTIATDGTKAELVDNGSLLKVYWSATDAIKVINTSKSNAVATLSTSGNSGTSGSASFSGDFSVAPDAGDNLVAFYPSTLSVSGATATVDLSAQGGTLDDVKTRMVMMATAAYSSSTKLSFANETAILKFEYTFPVACTVTGLTLTTPDGSLINKEELSSSGWSNPTKGDINVTLSSAISVAAGDVKTFYVAVFPESGITDLIVTAHTSAGEYLTNTRSASVAFIQGKYHTMTKTLKSMIGSYYYSDGTWGDLEDNNRMVSGVMAKTAIGVIFSTEPSTKDKGFGFTHGYAMALKNAARYQNAFWSSHDDYKDINDQSAYITDLSAMIADLDGYSHCHGFITSPKTNGYYDFNSTNYPAIYAALNFGTASYGSVINAAPSGTLNSGWYLPSIGQIYLILKNLGKLTDPLKDSHTYWHLDDTKYLEIAKNINSYIYEVLNSNANTSIVNNPLSTASNISDYFLGLKDPTASGCDFSAVKYGYYMQSSTEYSEYQNIDCSFQSSGYVINISSEFKTGSSSTTAFAARSVIAF